MRPWRIRTPSKLFVFCSFLFVCFVKWEFFYSYSEIPTDTRVRMAPSGQPCVKPKLDVDDPLMVPFFHSVPPLTCNPRSDLSCLDGSKVGLCRDRRGWNDLDPETVSCTYEFLRRLDDSYNVVLSERKTKGYQQIPLESDFFNVQCQNKDGNVIWHNTMAGIVKVEDERENVRLEDLPDDSMKLNYLFFGYDSLSRMTFMRKLPKTYEYLVELGAVVLKGYNIVGDGTPQALIPILTGQTELELPEARRRKYFSTNYCNVYPFIWKKFREYGYVTSYSEDRPRISTFNYRLSGFDQSPVDHYARTFFNEVDKVSRAHPDYCLGDKPRHRVLMDWIVNYFDSYAENPKFMFSFHNELSHDDINLIELTDGDNVEFLKALKDKGHLDNTLMIFISDHGHRFADVRETKNGKFEERLPFVSVLVPDSFKKKYPKAWANLQENADRLVSPFDLYSTVGHLLEYREEDQDAENAPVKNRSISLFHKIPELRSCEDAGIEPHWCTCLNWGRMDPADPLAISAANALVTFINNETSKYRSLCSELTLREILWAERYAPTLGLLLFKHAADVDGFKGNFGADTQADEEFYQVKVVTSPGDGHFEATLKYSLANRKFEASISDISRVNKYGHDADCITDDVQKYCYCKR